MSEDLKELLRLTVLASLATAMVMTCSSCKETEYVTVESARTDTVRIMEVRADTLVKSDSTVIRTAGDTVYTDRWHTVYRVRERTDTLYRSRTDSIPVPYEVTRTVEVERPLTWWQKTQMHGFRIMVSLLALLAAWKYRRRILSVIRALT